jgi:hypothetical protein
MNSTATPYKIRWTWPSAAIAVFAVAYGISILLGKDVRNSCFWAVVVNGIAGCGGIAPVIYAMSLKSFISVYYILSSSIIRLLLAVAGSGIILFFVKIDVMWFAAWVVILYLAVLIFEVGFAVQMMTKHDEVEGN